MVKPEVAPANGEKAEEKPHRIPKSFRLATPFVDLRRAAVDWICTTRFPVTRERLLEATVLEKAARGYSLSTEKLPRLTNPLRWIPDAADACKRIVRACRRHEKILLYGDYDCDGVISITLMRDALIAIGARWHNIKWLTSHRVKDGYGLKRTVLKEFLKNQRQNQWRPGLVIVLDCGTTAKKEIRFLRLLKMDVVIIDHHEPDPESLPDLKTGLIHLNPKLWLQGRHSELACQMKDLCAAGLTFLLAKLLVSRNPTSMKWSRDRAVLLAGLATCADVVSLTGLNRNLLKRSIELANDDTKLELVPGLAELRRLVGPKSEHGLRVTEETYGFVWGPCLNAPGRMDTAEAAITLLEFINHEHVRPWAKRCDRFNKWRRATERGIHEDAQYLAYREIRLGDPRVLLLCKSTWHPGVVGIVAARIRELHSRPSIICSANLRRERDGTETVVWRGSGRSIPKCDMGKIFHQAKNKSWVNGGGGHARAGGIEFTHSQKGQLQERLAKMANLKMSDLVPIVEALAPASHLSPRDWAWLFRKLAPFGSDNPAPALLVEAAELLAVRVRTRIPRNLRIPEKQTTNDKSLKSKEPPQNDGESKITEAGIRNLPRTWAYEGVLRDRITGKFLHALWLDREEAEEVWQVDEFREHEAAGVPFALPYLLKMHLELRAFVPSSQWENAKHGKSFNWDYCFQVRQCLPIAEGTIEKMRMPTREQVESGASRAFIKSQHDQRFAILKHHFADIE